jgi:hypothetical protein
MKVAKCVHLQASVYGSPPQDIALAPGARADRQFDASASGGWYDI